MGLLERLGLRNKAKPEAVKPRAEAQPVKKEVKPVTKKKVVEVSPEDAIAAQEAEDAKLRKAKKKDMVVTEPVEEPEE